KAVPEPSKLVVSRKRLCVVDVESRARDPALTERANQPRLLDEGTARRIDEVTGRLHPSQIRLGDQTSSPLPEHQVYRDHVDLCKQLFSWKVRNSILRRALNAQMRTPRNDAHVECEAVLRDPGAEVTQAHNPERPSGQIRSDRALPSAGAHRGLFGDEVADGGDDQPPGQLRGRPGQSVRSTHEYSSL